MYYYQVVYITRNCLFKRKEVILRYFLLVGVVRNGEVIMKENEKIKKIISEIELPETLYEKAESTYNKIAKLLEKEIGQVAIYPQGSFAIGTTIKPYKDGNDTSYDIDLIMETNLKKEEFNGRELSEKVQKVLDGYDFDVFDKCITIRYAVNGYGFNLDVVPAVPENIETKNELIEMGANPKYVKYSIAISSFDKSDENGWYTSIPKGYVEWFNEINKGMKQKLFEGEFRNQTDGIIYNTIEEIPRYKIKTPLQKVVELLKRFRDVYYSKRQKLDQKPISAIITTIVAKTVANSPDKFFSTTELLFKVISDLKVYSNYNNLTESEFINRYSFMKDIKKENNNWVMLNPVNPKDNLLDGWNEDSEIATLFFEWINQLEEECKKVIEFENDDDLSNLFGSGVVSKALNLEEMTSTTIGVKPYGKSC